MGEPQCFDEMLFCGDAGGGGSGVPDSGWTAAVAGVGAGNEQGPEGAEGNFGFGVIWWMAGQAVGDVAGGERGGVDGEVAGGNSVVSETGV